MRGRTIFIIAIAQIINYGVPIFTFPLLVRAFDLFTYGAWIEASTIVSLAVALGTLGLTHALGLLVVNRLYESQAVYVTALWVFGGISGGIATLIFILAPLIDAITTRNPLGIPILQVTALLVPCVAMNQLASQMFRLREQPLKAAIVDTVLAIARVIAAAGALTTHNLLDFGRLHVGLQASLTLIQVLIAFWGLKIHLPKFGIARDLLKQSLNLAIAGQANWLVMYGDRLMLSVLSVSSAVAIYAASYQLTLVVAAFAWPFLYPLLIVIGERWQQGDVTGLQTVTRETTRRMLILLIPAAVGLGTIGDSLVRFLATEDFAQGGLLIAMIAAGVVLDLLGNCLQYIHQSQGNGEVIRRIYIRGALLNLLANLIAIPLFSYIGAGVTTLVTFIYIFIELWRATGMPFDTLFDVRSALKCIASSGVMAIGTSLVSVPTLDRLLLAVGGGAVCYGLGLLLTGVIQWDDVLRMQARIRSRLFPIPKN